MGDRLHRIVRHGTAALLLAVLLNAVHWPPFASFPIGLALGAATIGGLIPQRLCLPALIGYILAGPVIGPNTQGLVADLYRVLPLANLGVARLLAGLGAEFTRSGVIPVRRADSLRAPGP